MSDVIDNIIKGAEKSKKGMVGIYFDDDVLPILKRLAKQGGRGAQSEIVNEAVRQLFKSKGLL